MDVDRDILGIRIRVERGRRGRRIIERVHVDEQIAVVVPVRARPGQAQRLGIPGDVEVLRRVEADAVGNRLGHAAVEADGRAAGIHPPPVGAVSGDLDVIRCEGCIHVDRPPIVHLRVAVGEDAGDGRLDALSVEQGLVGGRQRPAGRHDLGDLQGLGGCIHRPEHIVVQQLVGRLAGLPGQVERGRNLAQRQAGGHHPTRGDVAGQGQGDWIGRIQVHGDGVGGLRPPAGVIGGAHHDVVVRVVGLIAQVPLIAPVHPP